MVYSDGISFDFHISSVFLVHSLSFLVAFLAYTVFVLSAEPAFYPTKPMCRLRHVSFWWKASYHAEKPFRNINLARHLFISQASTGFSFDVFLAGYKPKIMHTIIAKMKPFLTSLTSRMVFIELTLLKQHICFISNLKSKY